MKSLLLVLVCSASIVFAHNSYTAGYSGAPGKQSCASSCHGGTAGTLTASGFPTTYQPQQTYRVTIKHNGGSPIVNFNATTRVGSTTNVAGTFAAVVNTTLYTGADGGVYASPHSIDSAVFQWTAPAAGTGAVSFYLAGYQGTTTSASGQSSKVTVTSSENLTGVEDPGPVVSTFALHQNYPNPFNPTTEIGFRVEGSGLVTLRVYDLAGREVATLVNETLKPGQYSREFESKALASGVYFYRLTAGRQSEIKKMVLLR